MATSIESNKYLLVSDSKEIGNQYDSKKLSQSELVELAQNDLFKKHLKIMSRYMTVSQYKLYIDMLRSKVEQLLVEWEKVRGKTWTGMLRPVDGQVILIDVQEFEKWNDAQETKVTPVEYLRMKWDIGAEFQVQQIENCMLRGVSEVDNGILVKGSSKVELKEENMPAHMHNSGITDGADIECLYGAQDNSYAQNGQIACDMFYNDSFTTGLDKNEMDGAVGEFDVQAAGSSNVSHNNLPKYSKFYAFVVFENN